MSNDQIQALVWCKTMPTSYYLACLETHRYVWVGTLDGKNVGADVDADLISNFCLMHRGKALVVVSETHQVIDEGLVWEL